MPRFIVKVRQGRLRVLSKSSIYVALVPPCPSGMIVRCCLVLLYVNHDLSRFACDVTTGVGVSFLEVEESRHQGDDGRQDAERTIGKREGTKATTAVLPPNQQKEMLQKLTIAAVVRTAYHDTTPLPHALQGSNATALVCPFDRRCCWRPS